MKRFEITPSAQNDLFEIEDFIARDSPTAARRVILELQSGMQKLAKMPHIGHRRKDIKDPRYRFWNVYSYLIVYDPEASPLRIIRVVHGHRDLPKLLDRQS